MSEESVEKEANDFLFTRFARLVSFLVDVMIVAATFVTLSWILNGRTTFAFAIVMTVFVFHKLRFDFVSFNKKIDLIHTIHKGN